MMVVELYREEIGESLVIPTHAKVWHTKKKLEWLLDVINPLVDIVFKEFCAPDTSPVEMKLPIGPNGAMQSLFFDADMRGSCHQIVLPHALVNVLIPGTPEVNDTTPIESTTDELYDSTLSFVRCMMDFAVLDDVVRAGDIDRLIIISKRLIPLFIGLTSYSSKYGQELINYLEKVCHRLSDKKSVEVRLQAFVNTQGLPGHNKPTDMAQENEVKLMKTICGGMGAGKTSKSLIKVSKAAPVLSQQVIEFGNCLGLNLDKPAFTSIKDSTADKEILGRNLRKCRPFKVQLKRRCGLTKPCPLSIIHRINRFKLNKHIVRHSCKAKTVVDNIVDQDEDDEDEYDA